MKHFILLFSMASLIACTCIVNHHFETKPKFSKLVLHNAEALCNPESGASTSKVICYNTYNSCWFWDCEHIWRCSTLGCEDVKCDDKSDQDVCLVD